MRKNLAKLIDVKSIVTLILTAIFAALAFNGNVSADQFLTVFTVVVSFYFGTQHEKNQQKESEELKMAVDNYARIKAEEALRIAKEKSGNTEEAAATAETTETEESEG